MSILVLTYPGNNDCAYLCEILKKRGVQYFIAKESHFPQNAGFHFSVSSTESGHAKLIDSDGREIDCNSISVVLNETRGTAKALSMAWRDYVDHNLSDLDHFINIQADTLYDSLYCLTAHAFWISAPPAVLTAEKKPYQLLLAKDLGFTVPATYIGNTEKELSEFLSRYKDVSLKTLVPHMTHRNRSLFDRLYIALLSRINRLQGKPEIPKHMQTPPQTLFFSTYAHSIDIISHAGLVKNCPMIIQEYIRKKFELRITIVGDKLFPCAIYSQESSLAKHDCRADLDVSCEAYELPEPISEKLLELMKRLGLSFGCVDMIVTPDDEYVFLEINPNGAWLWVEKRTGLPIGDAIADLLISKIC